MTQTPQTSSRKPHLITLDGLRGGAAISVVMLHWFEGNGAGLFHYSRMAVDFFFLLSGYVIAYSYEDRLRAGLSLRTFFASRLVRLYPMIVLGIILGLIREILKQLTETGHLRLGELAGATVLNLLMLPKLDSHANIILFTLNIALWSLFFEFVAYCLYAIVYVRAGKWALIATLMVALPGVLGWILTTFRAVPEGFYAPFLENTTIQSLSRVLFSYFLGVVVFRYQHRLLIVPGLGFLNLFALTVALFAMPPHALPAIGDFLVMAVLFPLVVLSASRTEPGPAGKWVAVFIGNLSYPLYVVHTPVMWTLGAIAKKVMPSVPVLAWGFVVIPIVMVFAYLCLKLYDEPVRAYLTWRFLKRSTGEARREMAYPAPDKRRNTSNISDDYEYD